MAGPILESTRNIDRIRKDPPESRVEPFERARIGVGSPEEARRIVASMAAREVDFIKIRTVANEETYRALNDAANAHGIPLVGHVTGLSPQLVFDAQQDGIDHYMYPSIDSEQSRIELWRQFARRGVPIVPTLSTLFQTALVPANRLRAIADDDAGRVEPRRRLISRYLVLDWREQAGGASDERRAAVERLWQDTIRRDLREMHAAGMNVLVGTDTAVLNIYPGFSLHDEMVLFVRELGMTPGEVLERATRRSAEFLRLGDSIGSIERGKVADLLLLGGDPLLDIQNTTRLLAVIVRGRVCEAKAVQQLKADVLNAPDLQRDDWGRTRSKR
jgi:imidazolonepropionase-like amidohydrolase